MSGPVPYPPGERWWWEQIVCPDCAAPVGIPCIDLRYAKSYRPARKPHAGRKVAARQAGHEAARWNRPVPTQPPADQP